MLNIKETVPKWVPLEARDRNYEIAEDSGFISISLKSSKSNFRTGLRIDTYSYLKDTSSLWWLIFNKYSSFQDAYPEEYNY